MSKLDELIAELCPDGVEYKTLQDITKAVNIGINPRKFFKLNPEGAKGFYVTVRELNGLQGVKQCDKTDLIDLDAVKIINDRANIEIGDILFSNTGTVGKMALVIEPPNNWGVNEGIYVIKPKNEIIESKFLYYLLSGKEAYNDYSSKFTGSTVKHITQAALLSLSIPVPPLPVQQEIVRILDNFTELTAELKAEIEARKKQYEYYRDWLLSQEGLNKLCPDGVEFVTVGEICDITRGRVLSKDYLRDNFGDYPVYSSQTANNGVFGYINTFDYDCESVTWTTDGANAGSVFYHINEKFSITNVCGLLRVKNNELLSTKFLFYVLQVYAKKYVNDGMGNPKLMSNVMAGISVPLPPLPVQQEIVRILDNFTELIAQLETELEARQKQYEYYRDKLLSFKEATA
ncbi:MAG TPA: restriction endonuclease subunit S [Fervidobacterium sp.]|nr:restriction endonuclease subunit S [Fervidobacterium sp.]HOL03635.1 restriction endonuclease subunit S [Fervidobacterium sp.]